MSFEKLVEEILSGEKEKLVIRTFRGFYIKDEYSK